MVHKKSEYRLQFHLLEKDLRKKIWQDNIKFRESCRVLNQADHYWNYQLTDERCECEDEEEGEEEEEDETTLPQHKLKHKLLLAKYGDAKTKSETENVPKQLKVSSSLNNVHQEEQPLTLAKHVQDALDIAIQTPDWESQKLSEKKASVHQIQSKPVREHEQLAKNEENIALLPISMHSNSKASQLETQPHRVHFKNNTSVGQPAERSIGPSSRITCPTKTARKTYFEERKSPFTSFGWNDSNRDIGQKKTYNIYAPEDEVYTPALLALKRRREAIEKYLAEKAHKKRQESSYKGHVNHSSIWMSEYQEKFSQGKKIVHDCCHRRPVSTPPSHRSCGWRYS